MKLPFVFIWISLISNLACSNKKTVTNYLGVDTSSTTKICDNLFVKNPHEYSDEFLGELEISAVHNPDSLSQLFLVGDNYLYGNKKYQFPSQIDSGRTYTFTGSDEKNKYELRLLRINATDLMYEYFIDGKPDSFFHDGKGIVTMQLYYIIDSSFQYNYLNDTIRSYLKYLVPMDDSYFYIYVEKNIHDAKLHAVVSKGIFIIRPLWKDLSPILQEM